MSTTRADNGGTVTAIAPEYSSMSPFNQNNTRLLLIHISYFALYDGSGNFLRNLPIEINASSQPRWSRTDPNVLYYVRGNALKQHNVGSGVTSVVKTFTEYSAITGNGESDMSFDGTSMVLVGNGRYVFVYNISTGVKGAAFDTSGHSFDSVYITNNYVTITWNSRGTSRYQGVELFDRNMIFQRQLTHAGGHMDVTTDVNGDEVLVWTNSADGTPIANCQNGVVKVRLADARQTCLLQLPWSLAVHISAPDRAGWVMVETYAPSDPMPSSWSRYANEIIRVKLDGTETRRLVHHRSRPFDSYQWQPKISVSRDGSKAVFGSNYSMQTISGYPSGYTDAYMIDVAGAGPVSGSDTPTPQPVPEPEPQPTPAPSPTPPSTPEPAPAPEPVPDPSGTTRYEQSSSSVAYSGTWHNNPMPVHSGSAARMAMDAGARATFSFRGVGANWIAYRDQWSGIAKIYVDGVLRGEVDTYASTGDAQAVAYTVSGLSDGSHTLAIEIAGRRNPSSDGNWVWIDAFESVAAGGNTTTAPTPVPSPEPAPTPAPTAPPPPPSSPTPATGAGGATMVSGGADVFRVGYATLNSTAASSPTGLAVLTLQQNGAVVSDATVAASEPQTAGRFFAEYVDSTRTGFAVTNPTDAAAAITFYFTNEAGNDVAAGSLSLAPHSQIARFLDEEPFNAPQPFRGSFTFRSSVPVAAVALRGYTNERSEFLVTTLPIGNPEIAAPLHLFFPHLADGGGWTTQFALTNPSDAPIRGWMEFFTPDGSPLSLPLDGATRNAVEYTIPARSSRKFTTAGTAPNIRVGSARIVAAPSSAAPVGIAIFGLSTNGVRVSQAGVRAIPAGTAFRLYAEESELIRTGVAMMNTTAAEQQVHFEVFRLDGSSAGMSGILTVAPMGQKAVFVDELAGFASIPKPFKGVVRIHAGSGLAVLGLRGRVNSRHDFLVTTLPAADEATPTPAQLVFPHIVDGGGYTTEFITFSGAASQPATANIQTYSQSGGSVDFQLR